MNENTAKVIKMYDGKRTSREVAKIVGLSPRYVRRIAQRLGLERLGPGARKGSKNHQYICGRRIDLDGYVLVTAPDDHPFARQRPNRKGKIIFEHRLIMENMLGRYLSPAEVVDHIDGLTLHNAPENLRLFHNNGEHLSHTTRKKHYVSRTGLSNITNRHRPGDLQPFDIYSVRRERGDVRLRQILLAALKLGIDSLYLSGTIRHLRKIGIDPFSRSSLERAYDELSLRWERDLLL